MECKCPFCKADISLEDVNVANDIALCRACGKTSSFAMLSSMSEVSFDNSKEPPRHIRIASDSTGDIKIVYRKLSPVLFFLIPFTLLWAGGSMTGIYIVPLLTGKMNMENALFGIPFLLGSMILVSIVTFMLFGRWELALRGGNGSAFIGVGPLGWTRYFSYNSKSTVCMRSTGVRVNNVPQEGICVLNGSEEIVFGSTIAPDAKRYLAAAIMREIQRY